MVSVSNTVLVVGPLLAVLHELVLHEHVCFDMLAFSAKSTTAHLKFPVVSFVLSKHFR